MQNSSKPGKSQLLPSTTITPDQKEKNTRLFNASVIFDNAIDVLFDIGIDAKVAARIRSESDVLFPDQRGRSQAIDILEELVRVVGSFQHKKQPEADSYFSGQLKFSKENYPIAAQIAKTLIPEEVWFDEVRFHISRYSIKDDDIPRLFDAEFEDYFKVNLRRKLFGYKTVYDLKKGIFDASMYAVSVINNPRMMGRSSTYIKYLMNYLFKIVDTKNFKDIYRIRPFLDDSIPSSYPDLLVLWNGGYYEHLYRGQGNYAAWIVKINASVQEGMAAYHILDKLIEEYLFEIGVFINVGLKDNYLSSYSGNYHERLIGIGIEPLDECFIAHSAVITNGILIE